MCLSMRTAKYVCSFIQYTKDTVAQNTKMKQINKKIFKYELKPPVGAASDCLNQLVVKSFSQPTD